jgi:hypothetical protein
MNKWDEPFLTTCDLCMRKTAAMPGPRFRRGRPEPPAGFQLGFVVEIADREFPICLECVQSVSPNGVHPDRNAA